MPNPLPESSVLDTLELTNRVFRANLHQQQLLARQQALNMLLLATVAKAVDLILQDPNPNLTAIHEALATVKSVVDAPPPTGTDAATTATV